jgi:hypothetical protein
MAEEIQAYLKAFLDVHEVPFEHFKQLDVRLAFSKWIRTKHQEFRKLEGLLPHPHYTPEMTQKFISYLRQGLAA